MRFGMEVARCGERGRINEVESSKQKKRKKPKIFMRYSS